MNRQHLRPRFWIEAVLAMASAVLTAVTLASPTWVERAFGASPDAGSGETEWALALAPLALAVVSAALAAREFRRARAA